MVTTTTKTLNYSIIRGNHTNSVNATITSTPGFNINYFGKIPGILKVVELVSEIIIYYPTRPVGLYEELPFIKPTGNFLPLYFSISTSPQYRWKTAFFLSLFLASFLIC
jgi:hypothetical protein